MSNNSDDSVPPGSGFQRGHAFHHGRRREERRADERRGLMLPFKSLSPALLTARIDLALPWIHPGRQQERMHKAHYSEHAYSHTCTDVATLPHKHTNKNRKNKHLWTTHTHRKEPLMLSDNLTEPKKSDKRWEFKSGERESQHDEMISAKRAETPMHRCCYLL